MKNSLAVLAVVFSLLVGGAVGFLVGSRCPDVSDDDEAIVGPSEGDREYSWSTMSEGPYHDQISFALSTDLLNWTDSAEIIAEHASVPDAIYKDGVIHVYFVDVSQDGKPEQIGLLRSEDDGQTWLPKAFVTIDGLGDKAAVDPDPFVLSDGRIRLYYFDIEAAIKGEYKIYSAISNDGINFVEEAGVRFERDLGLFDPDVIEVDGVYRMYVGGGEGKIILATSDDGLNFTEKGAVFDGGVPNVFYDGEKYILYTAGINIALADDGEAFVKQDYMFQSTVNSLTADPGVIKLGVGSYFMVYKTKIDESP